ncbi:cupin domain-containing protein [Arthrobacter sp. Alg241-R88]|uniref:(R)-mandelonitrile lyase n=1 Tax=Arthrobacter sp. Alg241-R88 TaxID=2305984 RepID=UPI0013D4D0E1|nr:cupin domain-containing protein [Arthrobacter sp. Alg241-R88]
MPSPRLTYAAATLGSVIALAGCSPAQEELSSPATSGSDVTVQPTAAAAASPNTQTIDISSQADRGVTPGPAEYFTGSVQITPLYSPNNDSSGGAARVTFQPGARTAWHTHPAGQRIIITEGRGWVQEWGGQRRDINAGDVVWFPAGTKHWHGATSAEAMTHIAVQDTVDGSNAGWLEHVSDAQYEGR